MGSPQAAGRWLPIEAAQNETRGQIIGNRILTLFGNPALMLIGLCPFTTAGLWRQLSRSEGRMVGLATAMFIGLFAFGHELFGWSGVPNDEVQLGLFLAFILGIVCGYKTKG
jgi:hypothetical protein